MRPPLLTALLAIYALVPALAHPARAQQPATQVVTMPTDSAIAHFQIPAGPLHDGLALFGQQSGVRIVARRAELGFAPGSAVNGAMTLGEAMSRLLAGSGFSARAIDGISIEVYPSGAQLSARELARVIVRDRVTHVGYGAPASSAASRLKGPLRDLPQSVSVVSRALIADQSMQNMAEVVRYMPGIIMGQGEGHRDAPTIRGNSSTADFFVDGVRDDVQYLRDLYNTERIEALQGANAMTFGRGGGGGVINRVTKEAAWSPSRRLVLEGGSFDHRRATLDIGDAASAGSAFRLNSMVERSDLFRSGSRIERFGVNPTAAFVVGDRTVLRVGLERFDDQRTVDRGIPSFAGAPSAAPVRTFFGDTAASRSTLSARSATVGVEHNAAGGVTLRNRLHAARYDKWYQNVFPGAVNAAGTQVALSAYASGTFRDNLFNQTEATGAVSTGVIRHQLLAGVEVGSQGTNNYRSTGYFNGTATSASVPFANPTVSLPVQYRQSASDADNRVVVRTTSAYVQDQLALGASLRAVVGVRVDRFALDFTNNRAVAPLARTDRMVSPRVGLVYKPSEPVSLYANASVAHLPGSGDQFASLTATTQTLAPERFMNREVGVKWDPTSRLSLTVAAYQLDRTNSAAPDPANAARLLQTGRQRSEGVELAASGSVTSRWQVQGGMAVQRAEIVERTSAAGAGARVPLVPRRSGALWNRYDLTSRFGAGLGLIHQGDSFAAIDNAVTLPAFTRADAALFALLGEGLRLQVNLENLGNVRYYATSHGNNNIQPGAPRSVRVTLSTGF